MSEHGLSLEEHRARHIVLHQLLDELVADFITCTGNRPSQTTLLIFMQWSGEQTKNPTEVKP